MVQKSDRHGMGGVAGGKLVRSDSRRRHQGADAPRSSRHGGQALCRPRRTRPVSAKRARSSAQHAISVLWFALRSIWSSASRQRSTNAAIKSMSVAQKAGARATACCSCSSAASGARPRAQGRPKEIVREADHLPAAHMPHGGLLAGLIDESLEFLGEADAFERRRPKAANKRCRKVQSSGSVKAAARDRLPSANLRHPSGLGRIGQGALVDEQPGDDRRVQGCKADDLGGERMVGSCRSRLPAIRISTDRGGGSSRVLSRALALSSFK